MLKEKEACLRLRDMHTDGLLLQDDDAAKAVPQQGPAGGAHLDNLGALLLTRQSGQGRQVWARDRLQGAAGAVPVQVSIAQHLYTSVCNINPCLLSSAEASNLNGKRELGAWQILSERKACTLMQPAVLCSLGAQQQLLCFK